MVRRARVYIGFVAVAGALSLGAALFSWSSPDLAHFALFLALTSLASLVKLRLPGIEGTYSPNALLVIVGITQFTIPEALLAACAAVLLQQLVRAAHRPTPLQVLFNVSNEAASVSITAWVIHQVLPSGFPPAALLALAASLYFALNTVVVSGILSVLEGRPLNEVYRQWYFWYFPYFLLGVGLVGLLPLNGQTVRGEAWIILLPLAYLLHFFSGLSLQAAQSASRQGDRPATLPGAVRLYVAAVAAAGAGVLLYSLLQSAPIEPLRLQAYLILAFMTATWKVRLPGMDGTISVHFVVILFAVGALSLLETVLIAAVGAVVQSYWKALHRPTPLQVVFNAACLALSSGVAFVACRQLCIAVTGESLVILLGLAAVLQYFVNTVLVAVVLCLVEHQPVLTLWRHCYFWSFPYYLVGAAAAGLMVAVSNTAGALPSLLVLPLVALVYLSYSTHVRRFWVAPRLPA